VKKKASWYLAEAQLAGCHRWIIEFVRWLVTSTGEEVNMEDFWSDCLPETLHVLSFGIDRFKAELDG
jgi:hypothetical protein